VKKSENDFALDLFVIPSLGYIGPSIKINDLNPMHIFDDKDEFLVGLTDGRV